MWQGFDINYFPLVSNNVRNRYPNANKLIGTDDNVGCFNLCKEMKATDLISCIFVDKKEFTNFVGNISNAFKREVNRGQDAFSRVVFNIELTNLSKNSD